MDNNEMDTMDMEGLLAFFIASLKSEGFLGISYLLVDYFKDLVKAVVFAELLSWADYFTKTNELDEDKMFYITYDKLKTRLYLSTYAIRNCIKDFVNEGLIETKMKGIPAKQFIKILPQGIIKIVKWVKNRIPCHNEFVMAIPNESVRTIPNEFDRTIPNESKNLLNKNKNNKKERNKEEINNSNSLEGITETQRVSGQSVMSPNKQRLQDKNNKTDWLNAYPHEDCKSLLRYWLQHSPPLPRHRPDSSVTLQALEALNKALHGWGYSEHDIRRAIDNYAYLLSNDTKVAAGAARGQLGYRVGLDEFFEWKRATVEMAKKRRGLPVEQGWFRECLQDRQDLLERWCSLPPDEYPHVTKRLREMWKRVKGRDRLSVEEEKKLRICAVKLVEFVNKRGKEGTREFTLNPHAVASEGVKLLFEAIEWAVGEGCWDKVTVGWLVSRTMFEDRLPAYLREFGWGRGYREERSVEMEYYRMLYEG